MQNEEYLSEADLDIIRRRVDDDIVVQNIVLQNDEPIKPAATFVTKFEDLWLHNDNNIRIKRQTTLPQLAPPPNVAPPVNQFICH